MVELVSEWQRSVHRSVVGLTANMILDLFFAVNWVSRSSLTTLRLLSDRWPLEIRNSKLKVTEWIASIQEVLAALLGSTTSWLSALPMTGIFTSGWHKMAKDSELTTRQFKYCAAITTWSDQCVTTSITASLPLAMTKELSNCGHQTLSKSAFFDIVIDNLTIKINA